MNPFLRRLNYYANRTAYFQLMLGRYLEQNLTPAVRRILILNVAVYFVLLVLHVAPGLRTNILFLTAQTPAFSLQRLFVWQFLTYMFVHTTILHLLFNMLVLWFFGPPLENRWGTRYFWQFYLTVGIGAGVLHALLSTITGNTMAMVVGASGAINGLMLAYAAYNPEQPVYFLGIFQMKMKHLVILIIVLEVFTGLDNLNVGRGDNISHLTHLLGLLVGYLMLARRHREWDIRRWRWHR